MGFTADLSLGIAQYLSEAGVGIYKSSELLDSDIALVNKVLPQRPDRAVAIFPYPLTEDPSLSDSVTGVQFKTRGTIARDSVDDIFDALFDALQGRTGYDLPTGIHVVQSLYSSGAPGGMDGNNRWERTDNFYFTLHRPSQYRT